MAWGPMLIGVASSGNAMRRIAATATKSDARFMVQPLPDGAGASVPTRRQETSQGLRHLRRHDRGRGVAQDAGGLEVGPYEGDAARAAGDVRVHDAPVGRGQQ